MPHLGPSPGKLETTSGCMEQVNAGTLLVAAESGGLVVWLSWARQPLVRNTLVRAVAITSSGTIHLFFK